MRRARRWAVAWPTLTGLLALAATWYAVFGTLNVAAAALATVCFLLGTIVTVSGYRDVIREVAIHPYFERAVGGISCFSRGQEVARHVIQLDQLVQLHGARSVSSFGWNDDQCGETLWWHDPSAGLHTFRTALDHLGELALDDSCTARLRDELISIEEALAKAHSMGIRFCLLLRHGNATNALEWEQRKGTAF